jgi:hypothetical protein
MKIKLVYKFQKKAAEKKSFSLFISIFPYFSTIKKVAVCENYLHFLECIMIILGGNVAEPTANK